MIDINFHRQICNNRRICSRWEEKYLGLGTLSSLFQLDPVGVYGSWSLSFPTTMPRLEANSKQPRRPISMKLPYQPKRRFSSKVQSIPTQRAWLMSEVENRVKKILLTILTSTKWLFGTILRNITMFQSVHKWNMTYRRNGLDMTYRCKQWGWKNSGWQVIFGRLINLGDLNRL